MSMQVKTDQFSPIRALVVGDVMLDRYWFGSVDRISPEAPVPVVAVNKEEVRVGGAANVAHNVLSLGARCELMAVVGDDEAGRQIASIIQQYGAKTSLTVDPEIHTIVKLRMLAQNQQLLRVDFDQAPSAEILAQCLAGFSDAVQRANVVVLSDYGKGGLTHVADMIKQAKAAKVPVIIDPKGTDYSRYRGATLITPNMKEFEAVAGVCSTEAVFIERAHQLREELELEYLLVTRSEKGMSLFCATGEQIDSPATALEVYDVSGAGDTVISLMALAAVSNFSEQDMLTLANTVAGIVVGKLGTAVATMDEVIAKLAEA